MLTKARTASISRYRSCVDNTRASFKMRQGKLGYGYHLKDVRLESALDVVEVDILELLAETAGCH